MATKNNDTDAGHTLPEGKNWPDYLNELANGTGSTRRKPTAEDIRNAVYFWKLFPEFSDKVHRRLRAVAGPKTEDPYSDLGKLEICWESADRVIKEELARRGMDIENFDVSSELCFRALMTWPEIGDGLPWWPECLDGLGSLSPWEKYADIIEEVYGSGEGGDRGKLPEIRRADETLKRLLVEIDAEETGGPARREPDDERSDSLSMEDRVIGALSRNPDASDAEIARIAGCNRTSLYRMERFKTARKAMERSRHDLPRGEKDEATGTVEAWDVSPRDAENPE